MAEPIRRRRWPRIMYVGPRYKSPGVGVTLSPEQAAKGFVPDGYIYPRPSDIQFDVTVRVPDLGAGATTELQAYINPAQSKGGWIRKIGYGFNNPHGFLHVRTFLLVDGHVPSNYMFRTVDAATGAFQGSLPPVQIGTLATPADIFVELGQGSRVSIRFVNANTEQAFSCAVRIYGWSFKP